MDKVKREHTLLKLAAYNCESFLVSIEIAGKDFLQDSFMKTLPQGQMAQTFAHGNAVHVFCNRSSKQIDYSAHVDFHKFDERSKAPKVHLHFDLTPTTALKRRSEEPPFAEEVFQWARQFISGNANISLNERANFAFSTTQYYSVFSLPSVVSGPLNLTRHEVFEDALMIGVTLLPLIKNKAGIVFSEQTVNMKSIEVTLHREIEANAQKLLSIETDVSVLHAIALSTVRPTRRKR